MYDYFSPNFCSPDLDTMAETGTIAGIVSAVAMALVGAVTSYISYQKKKFCFSIQRKDEQPAYEPFVLALPVVLTVTVFSSQRV